MALRVASVPALLARIDALAGGVEHAPAWDVEAAEDDDGALDAPVIALLDRMLAQAVADRATDLHFEPGPQGVMCGSGWTGCCGRCPACLRRRVGRVVARLKILAGLNIAERRLPQDGHIRAVISGATYVLRCATLPMVDGEGAAVLILAGRQSLPRVAGLGMEARAEARLREGLAQSHGLILVTGPTGSGKTTTLAAATAELNDPRVKIISIEDPVEYHIPGIAQVQVNPAIGLTFGTGLRAFMRADPDVLLVGEVRDAETANITVQAALSGHLVLTTLHTNLAAGAVVRLAKMGVEPYLLAATLRVSVGQRLVRRLCAHCRQAINEALRLPEAALGRAGIAVGVQVAGFRATGCDQCGQTGYCGRRAIFEVLSLTEPLRRLLLDGADTARLHAAAVGEGMAPLIDDGLAQVLAGVTSVEKVLRVVQDG